MNQQVLIFPRGQLTDADRARMEEIGVVAVEADDPANVVTVLPTTAVSGDDLFLSALTAVVRAPLDSVGMTFAKQLLARAEKRQAAQDGGDHA